MLLAKIFGPSSLSRNNMNSLPDTGRAVMFYTDSAILAVLYSIDQIPIPILFLLKLPDLRVITKHLSEA